MHVHIYFLFGNQMTYQFTILYILGSQDKITSYSICKYVYYLQSIYHKD